MPCAGCGGARRSRWSPSPRWRSASASTPRLFTLVDAAAVPAAAGRAARPPGRRVHRRQRRRPVRDQLLSRLPRLQGAEPGVHRHAGLQPVDGRREADRPVAPRDGRNGHRQLLSAARRAGDRRAHAAARRRQARRAAGGGHLLPPVEPRVRGQPVGRRPVDSHPRPAVHDRRRRAARRSPAWCRCSRRKCGRRWPTSTRSSRAASSSTVPSPTGNTRLERRGDALDVREGTPEAGRRRYDSAAANLRLDRQAAADRHTTQTNKRFDVSTVPTKDVHIHPVADRALRPIALGADARRRSRAGDRVRERGEHAAGARVRAPEGDRHPPRDRREPPPARAAAARRERRDGRRSARAAGVALAWAADAGRDVDRACRFRFRCPSRCGIDGRVLLFTAGVTMLAALSSPASRRRSKATRPNLVNELKSDVAATQAGGRRWTLRDGLVVTQIAVTMVLLVAAGLLTRSLVGRAAGGHRLPQRRARHRLDRDEHARLRRQPREGVLRSRARARARHPRRRVGGARRAAAVLDQLQPQQRLPARPPRARRQGRRDRRRARVGRSISRRSASRSCRAAISRRPTRPTSPGVVDRQRGDGAQVLAEPGRHRQAHPRHHLQRPRAGSRRRVAPTTRSAPSAKARRRACTIAVSQRPTAARRSSRARAATPARCSPRCAASCRRSSRTSSSSTTRPWTRRSRRRCCRRRPARSA